MARLARVVVPGYWHHITQRGNRRQPTFFSDDDYAAYLKLMAEQCRARGVSIRAWCLMPNHVHLVGVPKTADALAGAIGEAHRRYTRRVNFREGWRGSAGSGCVGGSASRPPREGRGNSQRVHGGDRGPVLGTGEKGPQGPLMRRYCDWAGPATNFMHGPKPELGYGAHGCVQGTRVGTNNRGG
jgi:REP element-mobilizing transposase RayT